jgi:hypothetical protein
VIAATGSSTRTVPIAKIRISRRVCCPWGATAAVAQNQGAGSSGAAGSTIPEAPIGHRQPRADQVPSEKNLTNPNDALAKENAILDKKMKSICRGC